VGHYVYFTEQETRCKNKRKSPSLCGTENFVPNILWRLNRKDWSEATSTSSEKTLASICWTLTWWTMSSSFAPSLILSLSLQLPHIPGMLLSSCLSLRVVMLSSTHSTPLLWQDNIDCLVEHSSLCFAIQDTSLQILHDFPFHICPSPKLSVSKHLILLGDVHLAVKSKVFKWENILVLEDFSLSQLTFLKLVRQWIMTKDNSMGFLISLKLLIYHQEARSNHSTPNLSHLDITEVSVDSE